MNIYKGIKLLAVFSVLSLSFSVQQADAQVFLRGDTSNSGSSSGSSDSSQPRSSNSFLMLGDRDKGNASGRMDYFKERVERSKTPQTAQSGQSYSIQEYNRLLSEQRREQSQQRTGAVTDRSLSSGQSYYPSSYLNRNVERVRKNPFTKRFATTAEIDKDIAAREAYYKKYPQLQPKQRGIVDERFFNKNGYYEDDKDLIVDEDGKLSQRVFGSRVELGNSTRATSKKYLDSANRFKNNDK